jgi:hypothetical protein
VGEAIGQMLPTAVGLAVSPIPIVAVVLMLFTPRARATIGVGGPVVIYFAYGKGASAPLKRLKDWMARNNGAVMSVLVLSIGVKLIGDAMAGSST